MFKCPFHVVYIIMAHTSLKYEHGLKMNSEKIELPISLAKEHISDFCVTLPLCVVFTEKKLLPWYHENFINICSTDRKKALCFEEYGQTFMGLYNEIFEFCDLPTTILDKNNVCELIISQLLTENKYCYIVLDEYYVSAKKAYNKYHFIHQSLIYGFDFNKKEFLAIAFNKNEHLDILRYKYEEVKLAFFKNIQYPSIIFFRLREIKEEYNFSPARFIQHLENYINSEPNYPNHFTAINVSNISRDNYGINAIRKTMTLFSKKDGIDYIDFKNIHFLYEHKLLMQSKLKYIECQGYLNAKSENDLQEYDEIVKQYTIVRMLALKALYLLDIDERFEIQEKVKKTINCLINEEINCLIRIIKHINLTYSTKTLDYLMPDNLTVGKSENLTEYAFQKTFTFSWNTEKNISSVLIPKHNLVDIIVDDFKSYRLFSCCARPELNYKYLLDSNGKKIEIRIYSDTKITDDRIPELYQRDLTYNKKVIASSYFDDDRKFHLEGYRYWRAAEQTSGYDGSDWIEVNFEKITKINVIVLGELDYSPRLKKYRIIYSDDEGEWKELLVHEFVTGEEQIHRFETINATKLRIEFLECIKEKNGYYEPIVNTFKVYYAE